MTIDKTVRIGTSKDTGNVFCKIEFDGKKLSITGVEGPRSNGDCKGSCGQINMGLKPEHIETFAPDWSADLMQEFLDIWDEWHLNDMRAGTKAQRAELAKHEFPGYPVSHYDWACKILESAGLHPDNGYKYGSAWLHEEIPDNVLQFLASLPDADKKPAWV